MATQMNPSAPVKMNAACQPYFNAMPAATGTDRKSTRLNSSHLGISYAVFCLKKKKKNRKKTLQRKKQKYTRKNKRTDANEAKRRTRTRRHATVETTTYTRVVRM